MHEMALAQDVLKLILSKTDKKVSFAKIGIGASRVSHPAELLELFGVISKGTLAEGAKLELEILPIKAICGDCKVEIEPKTFRLDCEKCGSTNIQVSSGTELQIIQLL